MSTKSLDIGTITEAFGLMGRYLRERHTVGALSRSSYNDRDFDDLVELAIAAGIASDTALRDLFSSFFPDEKIDPMAAARIPEGIEAVQRRIKP